MQGIHTRVILSRSISLDCLPVPKREKNDFLSYPACNLFRGYCI